MSNVSFAAVAVSFTHTVKGNKDLVQCCRPLFKCCVNLIALHFTALEPFFSAAGSQFVLGQQIPLSLWLSLAPVVIGKWRIHHHSPHICNSTLHCSLRYCANLYPGVSMASLTELSFNWTGFTSAMISNVAFTYRSIYSKKAMVILFQNYHFFYFFSEIESNY